ncbi:MAG: hypothetical protein NUW01_04715 [Gemmatimonadaceae bacterium]|nr:hypothetical protein [Gemmatimonadaceae bacterium]
MSDTEDIQRRVEATTPGPWEWWKYGLRQGARGSYVLHDHPDGVAEGASNGADLTFIAAARTDVPYLLAEVERLREALGDFVLRGEAAPAKWGRVQVWIDRDTFENAFKALGKAWCPDCKGCGGCGEHDWDDAWENGCPRCETAGYIPVPESEGVKP